MTFNFSRFGWRSFQYYFRGNAAIAAAVAIATAILTGALLIGSSMRGSLRALTLERLGKIDEILVAEGFFSADLAEHIRQTPVFQNHFQQIESIILFPNGSVEHESNGSVKRIGQVTLLGISETFWKLDERIANSENPRLALTPGSVIVNRALADELGLTDSQVAAGQALMVVRVPKPSLLPGDSSLGRKSELAESLARMKVTAIIENRGLGRFAPHPSPEIPRLAFLALSELQQTLHDTTLKHRSNSNFANQLLVAGRDPQSPPSAEVSAQLAASTRFSLDDLGIKLKSVRQTFRPTIDQEQTIFAYESLSTERLVFRQELSNWIKDTWPTAEPVLTYLVNNIQRLPAANDPSAPNESSGIPYSMFSAIAPDSTLGLRSAITGNPITAPTGDQVILNEWAAADLKVQPGDRLQLTYFEPESNYGQQVDRTLEVPLTDIAKLTEPIEPFFFRRRQPLQPPKFDEPPTSANDPDLTPEVPGVTDTDSMENWDLPFETSDRIRAVDDEYWANHRTTPKGFVSLELGQRLWGSRFGQVTSFRMPVGFDAEELTEKLNQQWRIAPQWFGIQWVPIKRQGLLASSGSTPFDGLFLGLSLFVIIAALLLVSLLFRLNLEQRSQQMGVARAVGFNSRRLVRLMLSELLLVSCAGAAIGMILGFLYAQAIISILTTWWVGAISQPFLQLHWQGWEPLVGVSSGIVMSLLTMVWAITRTNRRPVRNLLMGIFQDPHDSTTRSHRWLVWLAPILTATAIALAAYATTTGGEIQAGAFMGAGFIVLVAIMASIWAWLSSASQQEAIERLTIERLALNSLRRNPWRSLMTIGLMAVATFLIVAISSFRLRPTDQSTGGIDWVGSSSQSIFVDLNTRTGQDEILGAEYPLPDDTHVYSWRYKPGEDASCNNPYQSTQPRILGVTEAWISRFDNPQETALRWSGSLAQTEAESNNPWRLLDANHSASSAGDTVQNDVGLSRPIPVVIDKNTAMFSLKIYSVGQIFSLTYDTGETLNFQVVGFLENTVLQGSLMIAESDFVSQFPSLSGYRYFLIDTGTSDQMQPIATLRDRLADQGFDARRSREILGELMAVQNTYLTAFQSLGGLGLLLGTFGLAAVQLRNMVERRQELGLLRALGFSYSRLTWLLFWEQMGLLMLGLVGGGFAALCTTLPHYWWSGASIPWTTLAAILTIILILGGISGWWSARRVIRLPLLESLKVG